MYCTAVSALCSIMNCKKLGTKKAQITGRKKTREITIYWKNLNRHGEMNELLSDLRSKLRLMY